MRNLTLVLFSALVLGVAGAASASAQTQSAPAQAEQTPQQSDQSRDQDRNRAEDVTIGRDWKAQGGESDRTGAVETDKDHETVGRDWRAHPEPKEHLSLQFARSPRTRIDEQKNRFRAEAWTVDHGGRRCLAEAMFSDPG